MPGEIRVEVTTRIHRTSNGENVIVLMLEVPSSTGLDKHHLYPGDRIQLTNDRTGERAVLIYNEEADVSPTFVIEDKING